MFLCIRFKSVDFSYVIKFTNLILMYVVQGLATKVLVNEQLILSQALVNNLPTTVLRKIDELMES